MTIKGRETGLNGGDTVVRRVVLVAFPQVNILDVAGPCEVFNASRLFVAPAGNGAVCCYQIEVISTTPELLIETSSGVGLAARCDFTHCRGPIDTLLVAGGPGVWEAAQNTKFLNWLRRTVPHVRRAGSVCTGAFALAAARLLDGHRATTHWERCSQLARENPQVEVNPDAIFVRDGKMATSAGVTAGMDLALAFVEEDLGRDVALQVARKLVMFLHRPGGQSQFSSLLSLQAADQQPLRELQSWVASHLGEDLSVERLAERVWMSPRNFARVFRREVGLTPARFIDQLRVESARRRLEESAGSMDQIANECGFGSADSMRRSFLRVIRVTPTDYRSRFQSDPSAIAESNDHTLD